MRAVAVKLVALDIDGTIVAHGAPGDGLPSPRITGAVRRLRESGVAVVLASGRMFPGTARVARHLELDTPVVCQQGCSVHLLDGTMTHEFALDQEIAREIVAHARELGHAYEWFNPLRYLVSREGEASREYGRVSGIVPEYRDDPELSGVVPTGVGIISSAAEANMVHRELVARYGEALHVLDFPTVTVAVAPDANKGHALSLLCADLGVDRHDVVAIGDSVNDAPMLVWAGRGVALAHSDRYALDVANDVLPDGDEPVAQFLEGLVRTR